MTDLMIDLETLGTEPEAPIISIGAVFFDIEKKVLGPTFYMALDINEQIKRGRHPTGDTIKWWLGQADAAKRVFHEQARPTGEVLALFADWYARAAFTIPGPNKTVMKNRADVWGNGSTFDISLMENIFRMYGIECPWSYNKIMDLRTFKRFVAKGAKVVIPGTAHNALDDAIGQANYVMEHS